MWEYIVGLLALLRAFTGLRFFLIKRRVKGFVPIIPEAEPFFRKVSGKKVALLLHGFTSSPREFRDLSDYLAKHGISSYAPLLPGHGTSPERLAVVKHYQMIESVQEHIEMIAKDYDKIYLIGSSFGGNLALICAQHSKKVKGIITLGTPIFFRRHKLNKYLLLPVLRRIKIFQKKPKRVRDFIDKHNGSYRVVPLSAAYEMSKILEISKKDLSRVIRPVFTIYVDADRVVSDASHKYILEHVSSKNKEEFKIPESNHVILLGIYSKLASKEIKKFIDGN